MKQILVLVSVILMSACNGAAPVPNPIAPSPSTPSVPAVPQSTYTVSGVISEVTPSGRVPVEGVLVEDVSCDPLHPSCSNIAQTATTDLNGFYRLSGLPAGQIHFLWLSKRGYLVGEEAATFTADTRLDIDLVRR